MEVTGDLEYKSEDVERYKNSRRDSQRKIYYGSICDIYDKEDVWRGHQNTLLIKIRVWNV